MVFSVPMHLKHQYAWLSFTIATAARPGLFRSTKPWESNEWPRVNGTMFLPLWSIRPLVSAKPSLTGMDAVLVSWTNSASLRHCGGLGRERRSERVFDDGVVSHGG